MGRYDSLLETNQKSTRPPTAPSLPRQGEETSSLPVLTQEESTDNQVNQSVSQSTGQSTNQSASRPTTQSMDQPVGSSVDESPILGRPKAFYITKKQDAAIDAAVGKLSEKLAGVASFKVDRSMVIRALLDTTDIAGEDMIEKLASTLVNQLVSRLTSRPVNQSTR